jgi:lactoylglutathione lyase
MIIINHLAISVTDLEESEQFYREVIGLTQIEEPFGVGRHAWFDIGGGAELHIIRAADERRERDRNNHLCFSVSSMESFIERIEANGVEWYDASGKPGEINIRPDGIQQIYFTDPDGYWIEINDDF